MRAPAWFAAPRDAGASAGAGAGRAAVSVIAGLLRAGSWAKLAERTLIVVPQGRHDHGSRCDTERVAGHDDLPGLASRIRAAAAALRQLAPAVERGRPWPLSDDFSHAPEAHWGPPETLAHVAEMIPYWTGEIERVLDAPAEDGPVPFGRTGDDLQRLGVLERDRTLPPRELFARIEAGAERLARRLETLDEADAGRVGVHW